MLKMNTHPVQNEHPPIYISKTTSENTFLSRGAQPNEFNQHQPANVDTIQTGKPEEREKINISEEMIRFWNEIVEENNPERRILLNTKRNQHLNAAFKQFFESDMAKWEEFCHKITTCKFLMGEKSDFKASIDWSIRFDTMQKIREGAYTFGTRSSKHTLTLSGKNTEDETIKASSIRFTSSMQESDKATVIRATIKHTINDDAQYRSWFLPTEILIEECEDVQDKVVLCVSTQFMGNRIQTLFRDIYEHYFDSFFVGSAEAYLASKNKQLITNDVSTAYQNRLLYQEESVLSDTQTVSSDARTDMRVGGVDESEINGTNAVCDQFCAIHDPFFYEDVLGNLVGNKEYGITSNTYNSPFKQQHGDKILSINELISEPSYFVWDVTAIEATNHANLNNKYIEYYVYKEKLKC